MRELVDFEIDEVDGAFGLHGAVIGGAIGLGSAIYAGGSASNMLAATALGAASGAAGQFAGSAAAGGLVLRGAWGVRAVGLGIGSSVASSPASANGVHASGGGDS